jgi:hypothetical protein
MLRTFTATTFNSVFHLHIGLHIYWFTIIVSGICKMELRTSDLDRSFENDLKNGKWTCNLNLECGESE